MIKLWLARFSEAYVPHGDLAAPLEQMSVLVVHQRVNASAVKPDERK